PPALMVEQVGRSLQARRERPAQPRVPAPEFAHVIAISGVPLRHSGWMIAELIAARSEVPGLRDQLDPRQGRILQQGVEEACTRIEAVLFAAKSHAEIEAETVHMKFVHPIAQRIECQLNHATV